MNGFSAETVLAAALAGAVVGLLLMHWAHVGYPRAVARRARRDRDRAIAREVRRQYPGDHWRA